MDLEDCLGRRSGGPRPWAGDSWNTAHGWFREKGEEGTSSPHHPHKPNNFQGAPECDVDLRVTEVADTTTRVVVLGSPSFLPDTDRSYNLYKGCWTTSLHFQTRSCSGKMANNKQGRVLATISARYRASGFTLKHEDGPSSNFSEPNEVGYHDFTVLLMHKDSTGTSKPKDYVRQG